MAQYLGDGMLIYFGWPVAHENDAQRALRAGLGIVEAIATSLARLWQSQGKRQEAYDLLAPRYTAGSPKGLTPRIYRRLKPCLRRWTAIDLPTSVYGWFSEGLDTADVQVAKSLLEDLRHS